jgi:hypothetical protein
VRRSDFLSGYYLFNLTGELDYMDLTHINNMIEGLSLMLYEKLSARYRTDYEKDIAAYLASSILNKLTARNSKDPRYVDFCTQNTDLIFQKIVDLRQDREVCDLVSFIVDALTEAGRIQESDWYHKRPDAISAFAKACGIYVALPDRGPAVRDYSLALRAGG